jgi:transcriptional repressor NF-X1
MSVEARDRPAKILVSHSLSVCAYMYLCDTVRRCFCGSAQDPKPPRLATPHSCGNPCSRTRLCGHPCPLPCHPGPCPPCMITIQNPCHCGRDVVALVCSRANPTTGGKINFTPSRSCGRKCGKPLSCRNHVCPELCHDGECPPCSVTEEARCWCGKERKSLDCGAGDAKECNILTADGEESWTGKFGCDKPCERSVSLFFFVYCDSNMLSRPFVCGIHKCSKSCHPPSLITPECPYSPSVVTHCPCGKYSLSDPAAPSHFGGNTKLLRTACTDPIPTCLSLCERPLEGCTHSCRASCHTGPCPPCAITLVRPCRCGATTRSLTCGTATAETESTAFLCNKPCGALRACGHHQCTRLCCPLANLANPTSKSKKKTANNTIGVEFVDVDGWHLCDVVCGKPLNCGNHRCEERDHRGSCPPCFQSSFEEV